MLETDRPHVLREMIYVCRPAGTLSVPGVYGGLLDKIPFGALMNKGLTLRTGQTHVNRWTDDLLHRILDGQIDPSFVITHRVPLDKGPEMYKTFRDKQDGCIKVMLQPNGALSWPAGSPNRLAAGGPARCTTRWRRGSDISRSRSGSPNWRCRARSAASPASTRPMPSCAATASARSRPASRSWTTHDATPWIWGRVAGDALDIATVALAPPDWRGGDRKKAVGAGRAGSPSRRSICSARPASPRRKAVAGPRAPITATAAASRGVPQAARGAARDFQVPRDIRGPEALRPQTTEGARHPAAPSGEWVVSSSGVR